MSEDRPGEPGEHADRTDRTDASGSPAPEPARLHEHDGPIRVPRRWSSRWPHRARRASSMPWWAEALVLLVGAVVVALVLKSFVVQSFSIPSASMQPTLQPDDRVLVQKVSYWFGGTPQRGDVVVFSDPGGWLGTDDGTGPLGTALSKVGLYPTGGHLVKRVIGVAGDTVRCCDAEGRISVNGHPLDEDGYITESEVAPTEGSSRPIPCNGPMTPVCRWRAGPIPDGSLFVMGDHRDDSDDSSAHLCVAGETDCTENPYVDVDLVVGKVVAVAWPPGRIQVVDRPVDFDDVPAPPADPDDAG